MTNKWTRVLKAEEIENYITVWLYPGYGANLYGFATVADNEEEALENVADYLVEKQLHSFYMTPQEYQDFMKDYYDDLSEEELEEKMENDETVMYVDTGRGSVIYLTGFENAKFEKGINESYIDDIAIIDGSRSKGGPLSKWSKKSNNVMNKDLNKKIKSFNLKDAITKIQDRYHELMDIGSWSDAEWFKKGEYAYIYIPVNKFDFRKNVTTGETDKEAVKALEELSGQKVEIIKIKATIKGPYDVMTADAKPTLVDVRFEDGQVWEDVNTEWLKHQPFGEDEDKKQIEAQIEDNRHIVERISDLLDSGFEQEEIINIVCNEFECEPQEVEQFLRKVTYASKVVSEREAGKDLNLAIRKANKVLKEEIYRWDIGRRDVAKSVAKNFEEITGVNINQLFTKVDDQYGSVIENVNAKLFDKQIPKIYKWVKNNFKIDKYDYETMQQDSDFIDMITDELVDMVDIDKVEYDKR